MSHNGYCHYPLSSIRYPLIMQPLVSVLILNYRNPNAAVACVQKFLEQTIADRIEILVIDNHSDDESVGVLRNRVGDHPQVRIIETPSNDGFGFGYNTGASYATGEYLLINNPDKTFWGETGEGPTLNAQARCRGGGEIHRPGRHRPMSTTALQQRSS